MWESWPEWREREEWEERILVSSPAPAPEQDTRLPWEERETRGVLRAERHWAEAGGDTAMASEEAGDMDTASSTGDTQASSSEGSRHGEHGSS